MYRYFIISCLLHGLIVFIIMHEDFFKKTDTNAEYAVIMEVVPVSEMTNLLASKSKSSAQPIIPTEQVHQNKDLDNKQNKTILPEKKETTVMQPLNKQDTKTDNHKTEKTEKTINKHKINDKNAKPNKKESKKVKKDDLFEDAFIKNIEKKVKADKMRKNQTNNAFSHAAKGVNAKTNSIFNENAQISISDIDMVRSKVQNAWNTMAFSGAKDAMRTTISITLDKDGEILTAQTLDSMTGKPLHYAAFVSSAIQAVREAMPFDLPKDKYHAWKTIEFTFDSAGMVY